MKNTPSQTKNSYSESPKTPGGISKSLLTPCRRVGLSRNWRKKGTVSPFISPLGNSSSTAEPQSELRKRKKSDIEESDRYYDINTPDRQLKDDNQNESLSSSCNTPTSTQIRTPSRSLIVKKKSKTLLLTSKNEELNDNEQTEKNNSICKYDSEQNRSSVSLKENLEENSLQTVSKTSKLLRLKTKNKTLCSNEHTNELLGIQKGNIEDKHLKINNNNSNPKEIERSNNNVNDNNKEKSPNNLSKECIVVIQKNILKSIPFNSTTEKGLERNPIQTTCESDNDDIPLCNLGSNKHIKQENNLNYNDEIVDRKSFVKKIDKTTSVTDLKKRKIKEKKPDKKLILTCSKTSSQSSNSFDDNDDFQMEKRTILIKKSYSKIVKPSKSKSTGSISQKDIDELQARIEKKKNLLIAKAMTNETEELRGLIKRWKNGCQNALTELFELMKKKMPEQNMDYSEILKMLKIPADLVGYDSENDCFNTPDDKNIILSSFNLNKI